MKPSDICVSTDGRERRFIASGVSVRASKRGDGIGLLSGYAAKYGKSSVDLGGFLEVLAPGCFRSVMADDCRCLFDHRSEAILGRTTAGTLELVDDDEGLSFNCDLPDTSAGRDVRTSIKRRDITGCSFAFTVAEDGDTWDFNSAVAVRTIVRIARLYDVGPVTYPAYESTEVDARSLERALQKRSLLPGNPVSVSLSLANARLRLAAASH